MVELSTTCHCAVTRQTDRQTDRGTEYKGCTDLTVVFLDCQPLVDDELIPLLRLYVTNDDVVDVPAAKLAFTRVVMPQTQVVDCSEWSVANEIITLTNYT